MQINSQFDGGNIECLSTDNANAIRLRIRKDKNSDFYQWFYFQLSGAQGQACQLQIENAAGAAYPGGWKDYQAVGSYDLENWFRLPTEYENRKLDIVVTPELDSLYIAYFAPYSLQRHAALINKSRVLMAVTLNCCALAMQVRIKKCFGPLPDNTLAKLWQSGGWRAFCSACWTLTMAAPANF